MHDDGISSDELRMKSQQSLSKFTSPERQSPTVLCFEEIKIQPRVSGITLT